LPAGGVLTTVLGDSGHYLMARINALADDGKANILSSPRVMTLDNVEAVLENLSTIQRTTITTQAFINEGESLLIGGYKSDIHNNTQVSIPGLSSIPVLGALFKFHQKETSHVEHLFMLTPRVIER
jgi:type III secretion protein C